MLTPVEKHMRAAIAQAEKGWSTGNYPIGAVIVRDGKIIARSHNRTKTDQDPTQHAEVATIRKAAKKIGRRHLGECVLYTTHEPCPMCATACVWARLDGVIIGAVNADMDEYRASSRDKQFSWRTIAIPAAEIFRKGDPQVAIVEGFMRSECKQLFRN